MTRIGGCNYVGIIHVKLLKVNNCFSDLDCHGTDLKSVLKVGLDSMPKQQQQQKALHNSILLSPFQLDFSLCVSVSAQRAAEPEPCFQQNGNS